MSKGGDKNDIIEFTYDDWVKGKIPGIAEQGVKRGLSTYLDHDSLNRRSMKISDEEFDKIEKKQKEIYERHVIEQLESMNNVFQKRLDRSSNKERLLGKEIEYYQFLFFPEKEDFKYPKPHTNRTIGTHYLSQIRALYIKLIEKDGRDYSHIKYVDEKENKTVNFIYISDSKKTHRFPDPFPDPNPENVEGYHIHVEAAANHLDWLEQKNGELSNSKENSLNLDQIDREENKFCPSMPLDFAIGHFRVFTKNKSKNGRAYLTLDQFDNFIKRAFLGDININRQTFNMGAREKGYISKRFWEFYDSSWQNYESTNQCRDKYIRLLTDNFKNWDFPKTKNNFGNKVKRTW